MNRVQINSGKVSPLEPSSVDLKLVFDVFRFRNSKVLSIHAY